MRERVASVLEGVVILAIVLVLIQTLVEDLGTLLEWNWSVRRFLIFTGFFFDLFFTIEFLVRMYSAVFQGRGGEYFARRRGWIDFIASIPLLLLSSGPAVLTVVSGGTMIFAVGGILNVLKVIKAVRIARILRLLRVLKVFKQIKYTDSAMAQRHVAKITSMSVTLFVSVVFFASIASGIVGAPSGEDVVAARHQDSVDILLGAEGGITTQSIETIADVNEDLLIIKIGAETVYTRHSNEYYSSSYGPSDYEYFKDGEISFFFDNRTAGRLQSKDNLIFFSIIVLLVALLLVYYSPHFALTVTDPIHVMRKGLDDSSYNFEVKIPRKYEDDDIYRLAQSYNTAYLPLKDRNQDSADSQSSLIDFGDVKDLLDEE